MNKMNNMMNNKMRISNTYCASNGNFLKWKMKAKNLVNTV